MLSLCPQLFQTDGSMSVTREQLLLLSDRSLVYFDRDNSSFQAFMIRYIFPMSCGSSRHVDTVMTRLLDGFVIIGGAALLITAFRKPSPQPPVGCTVYETVQKVEMTYYEVDCHKGSRLEVHGDTIFIRGVK